MFVTVASEKNELSERGTQFASSSGATNALVSFPLHLRFVRTIILRLDGLS
jgi:hypothetical protein